MPIYFQWLTNINYIRFGLTSCLINSYGFGRCDQEVGAQNGTFNILDAIPGDKLMEIASSDKIDSQLLLKSMNSLITGNKEGENISIIMDMFLLTDSDYYFCIFMLFIHNIIYRSLTYYVILKKVVSKTK